MIGGGGGSLVWGLLLLGARNREPETMMKNWKLQTFGMVVVALIVAAGCKPADTGSDPGPQESPTPADPQNPYTAEDYAKALRTASIKLRGQLPSVDETQRILDAKEPRLEYESLIDEFLDPASNPALGDSIVDHFKQVFLVGDTTENVTHLGVNYTVNHNALPNLATHLILNDKSWKEILTAEYYVDDNFQMQTDVATYSNSPVLAGALTDPAYLRKFGNSAALNYQRASITHQLFECGIYPNGTYTWLARTNSSASDPSIINAEDDPGSTTGGDPRVHKKYAGVMEGVTCHTCHNNNAMRQVWAKYVTDEDPDNGFGNVASGFYEPTWTMLEVETPVQNTGKCYAIPAGFTYMPGVPDAGGNNIYDCDQYADVNQAMASNGGCCFDPITTDMNAEDNIQCMDPNSEWCYAEYHGIGLQNPRDYALAILNPDNNNDAFAKCQTRRFYTWVVGTDQGELGLNAANGVLPENPGDGTIEKYRSAFEHSGWNGRELLSIMFKGDEFLSSQVQ